MTWLIALNLTRHRGRTLLTALGIAVGVATIVALLALTTGLKRSAAGLIHLGNADFGVFQSNIDPTASRLPLSLVGRLRRVPGVKAATPIQLVVKAVAGSPGAIVFGARPQGFFARRAVIERGRGLRRGRGVLVGDQLASDLHARVGGRIRLKRRRVAVAGIFHSGVAFEDAGVIAPLALAQRLGGDRGAASTVAVLLAPGAASEAVSARIKRRFPGTKTIVTAAEAANASTSYRVVSKAVLVIVVLALVIGVISVTNTMAMAVLERQRELALLAAVGFSRSQIAGLILGEGVGLSVLGVALGLALGVVVAEAIVAGVASGALVSPAITAWGLGRGALVGVVIGVLGGLYPAWRVTRLRPAVGLARA